MPLLTKTDAARQLGIARATLYKLIAQGKVSPTPEGMIDQAELVRVAPYIDTLHKRTRSPKDAYERLQASPDTPPIRPQDAEDVHTASHAEDVYRRLQTGVSERLQTSLDIPERLQMSTDTLVDILREQLRLMQEREREQARLYEERERDYREHIARLTTMLDQAHQQNQRLLDMPRSTPPLSPQDAPGATQPPRRPIRPPARPDTPQRQPAAQDGDPRGAMRRRIVVLLQAHPDGLTPAEMRTLLGVGKSLADTCLGMLRYGLVQRVERGKYVATEPSRTDHT